MWRQPDIARGPLAKASADAVGGRCFSTIKSNSSVCFLVLSLNKYFGAWPLMAARLTFLWHPGRLCRPAPTRLPANRDAGYTSSAENATRATRHMSVKPRRGIHASQSGQRRKAVAIGHRYAMVPPAAGRRMPGLSLFTSNALPRRPAPNRRPKGDRQGVASIGDPAR